MSIGRSSRKAAAEKFVETWRGRGYEKGDTHSYWLSLLRDVIGMKDVTTNVLFEAHSGTGGFIDVSIPDAKTLIEQKSLGVSLDKPAVRQGHMVTPFQQVKVYADSLPNSQRPDHVIVSNFEEIRIHSLDTLHPEENFLSFKLEELPDQLHLLDFLLDPQRARQVREEKASMDAGILIGKLYNSLRTQYLDPDSPESQHALNVLCVRLVFCLFAEDAEIFPKDSFGTYLKGLPAGWMRDGLKRLFVVLDTPVADRDPYLPEELKAFPYVNGGLFRQSNDDTQEVPPFTEQIRDLLINEVSQNTNWSEISPTIFGGVFESTLNPETRAEGGMHYTSPENIHRVIDPLFLNDLKAELQAIVEAEGVTPRTTKARLERFHTKISELTFFDPACGSGNFLTETYISLRRLENKVLSALAADQTSLAFEDIGASPLKVSLSQFYGLEINDFAVSVATTALWIAQLQANAEAAQIVLSIGETLPLKDSANIHCANALRTDWAEIIAPQACNFIIGNPPFLGYSRLSAEQKEDRKAIFGKDGGLLDYVACWHRKAASFMKGTTCEAALVSTNSICQGQQVLPLWKPLFNEGITINFAHRTFVWSNEATNQAHVYCVIIGFSYVERKTKQAWTYSKGVAEYSEPKHLNGYLADAPDVFLPRRSKPISAVPEMAKGFQPTDNGHLLLSPEERAEILAREPGAETWIRKFSMGAEFINGKDRYCLWLPEITGADLKKLPVVRSRIDNCRSWREQQTKTGDAFKLSKTPHLLRPTSKFREGTYIGIPPVSSERRKVIPIGFVTDGMIPGNQLYFIPTDSLFVFGMLMSTFHNAWMRAVAGRLEMRYRYGNTTVYNNFVFPDATEDERADIEACAQAVLDARAKYAGATLADLYDPDNDFLYPELIAAHRQLDVAVERAYGVDFNGDEVRIVAHLFELYAKETTES